jgi:Invasion associated locus B (IalB) protein
MDRCAVGESADGAVEKLTVNRAAERRDRERDAPARESVTAFPKRHFPAIHRWYDDRISSHLPVTIMGEPDLVMSVRRMLTALVASVLMCGVVIPAQAQNASPKAAAKPAPAKPETKPAAAAASVAGGAEPTLIGQFGTWGAYTATPNGKKVCFALAKPSSSKTNPPNRPRDPAYAFVSTRPAEKVTNEVSVMIGYAVKPGSESTLEVGGASYAMYTQGDGLWIKNAAEEERMVDAMRKAADVTVKGVSAKGTETTDTFSLKGLAQALDRLAQDCRR